MPDLGVDWPDLNATDATRRRAAPLRPEARPVGASGAEAERRFATPSRSRGSPASAMPRSCSRPSASSRRSRRTARIRPTPRRSAAAPAPTPICLPNCCAARAIMTRWSSRGPRRAGDDASRRPRPPTPASNIVSPRSSCRGSTRPGPDAAQAARRFRGQGRRPGHRRRTSSPAGVALTRALGEEGFAERQDRRAGHRGQSPDPSRDAGLPVDPGPVARFGAIRVTGQPPFSARHVGDHRAVQARRSRSSARRSTICAAR